MEDKLVQKQQEWTNQQKNISVDGQYWWVTGIYQGKRFLFGPTASQQDAYNLGLQKAGIIPRVFSTSGRDRTVAAQKLKAMLLQETQDLPESMKRLRRKEV